MSRVVSFLSSLGFFFAVSLSLLGVFIWQTVWSGSSGVFRSPWFFALSMLLALNTALCLLRKMKKAPRYFVILHAGVLLVMVGSALNTLTRFEAVMKLGKNRPESLAVTDEGIYRIPHSLELLEFAIEYYRRPRLRLTLNHGGERLQMKAEPGAKAALGSVRFQVLELLPDFARTEKGAFSRSPFWNNPALRLQVEEDGRIQKRWLFLHFPGHEPAGAPWRAELELVDGEIKNYFSRVRIHSPGESREARVAVNEPLRHRGYTFHQLSYDPSDPDSSVLSVKRERFLWLVYGGFILLITGVFLWLLWKPS